MLVSETELQVKTTRFLFHLDFVGAEVIVNGFVFQASIVAELVSDADVVPSDVAAEGRVQAVSPSPLVLDCAVGRNILDEGTFGAITHMEVEMQTDFVGTLAVQRCKRIERERRTDGHAVSQGHLLVVPREVFDLLTWGVIHFGVCFVLVEINVHPCEIKTDEHHRTDGFLVEVVGVSHLQSDTDIILVLMREFVKC